MGRLNHCTSLGIPQNRPCPYSHGNGLLLRLSSQVHPSTFFANGAKYRDSGDRRVVCINHHTEQDRRHARRFKPCGSHRCLGLIGGLQTMRIKLGRDLRGVASSCGDEGQINDSHQGV